MQEPMVGTRLDFGEWSVFEICQNPAPRAQVLPYRPALLIGDLTVKRRRQNWPNFIRFAEEQFFDNWFNVLLVHTPEERIDILADSIDLSQFGALILDKYECDDCELSYNILREVARRRPVILMMSHTRLFHRIRANLSEFKLAYIIERSSDDAGHWMDNIYGPTDRYQSSSIRAQWKQIRDILEEHKVETEAANVNAVISQNSIQINYDSTMSPPPEFAAPVLVRTSYHPNWQRNNGQAIYAVTPMFMVTFVNQSTNIIFTRRWFDWGALSISALVFVTLIGISLRRYRHREVHPVANNGCIPPV